MISLINASIKSQSENVITAFLISIQAALHQLSYF